MEATEKEIVGQVPLRKFPPNVMVMGIHGGDGEIEVSTADSSMKISYAWTMGSTFAVAFYKNDQRIAEYGVEAKDLANVALQAAFPGAEFTLIK